MIPLSTGILLSVALSFHNQAPLITPRSVRFWTQTLVFRAGKASYIVYTLLVLVWIFGCLSRTYLIRGKTFSTEYRIKQVSGAICLASLSGCNPLVNLSHSWALAASICNQSCTTRTITAA